MKRILFLLAILPFLFSCDFESPFSGLSSPTIKGFAYSTQYGTNVGDEAANKALEAVSVGKSKFEGKKGDKVEFQVQLNKKDYGGKTNDFEMYWWQEGTLTYESETKVTSSKMNGTFTFIEGTWDLLREEDGDKVTLTSGDKIVNLKFWHEND
jgi:hypothetical protein